MMALVKYLPTIDGNQNKCFMLVFFYFQVSCRG